MTRAKTRQNILATFFLKNISKKLPLAAFGLFFSSLASSSSVKVSSSVVSTTSKSPKIFNNRPVNKLVFPAFTTLITTTTTTVSQIAAKAKNSKKHCVVRYPILEAKQSINSDDLKDWADQINMESIAPSSISGVADSNFLMWLLSFPFLCHDIPLSTSFDNIKAAFGGFGVVTLVKLKPVGLKDSIKILSLVNQKEVIVSRDTFKAKLVNLPFGCTAYEISDLVFQIDLDYLAVNCKVLPLFSSKVFFNSVNSSKVFEFSFAGAKSYAKAVSVILLIASAADVDSVIGAPSKARLLLVPVVSLVLNSVVESRLASMEFHFDKLFLLIKSIIESVGSLVVLVIKLLFILPAVDVIIDESLIEVEKQVKVVTAVCDQVSLEKAFNDKNMDDNNDDDKDFSVYNDTFNVMIHL
ncbi:hypothetical protein G9A89_011696 [Geosiphon pyriformis]|nr:hypothetical protein G9A89_011696 [Geosiphon pyriformis]